MSGTSSGAKKAEQLRFVADEKCRAKSHAEFAKMYNYIIQSCESTAKDGRYEFSYYDDKLSDSILVDELKRALKSEGFKVSGGLDAYYSAHADKNMYFIRVSWQ